MVEKLKINLPKHPKKTRKANVQCRHCGYKWYSDQFEKTKKPPKYCINCYKQEVGPIPGFLEFAFLKFKKKIEKIKKERAERKRRGTRLRLF